MTSTNVETGRAKQKLRTRRALLQAARDLLDDGHNPTLEEVAEVALVSRATAYRYFPSIEALLAEAALEQEVLDPDAVIGDREELLERVLAAVAGSTDGLLENEVAMHVMAKSMADRWLAAPEGEAPARPAHRLDLIDAALAPHADRLGREQTERLRRALALITGMEAVLSARDVIGLDRDDAREAFAWAARALVDAAEQEASGRNRRRG